MERFLRITKALSDETRVRALMAVRDRELCLCQLIDLLGLAPSTVSKHMAVLQQAGLIQRRKDGRWHFYRLADDSATSEVKEILNWALGSLGDNPLIASDREKVRGVCRKDLEVLAACYKTGGDPA